MIVYVSSLKFEVFNRGICDLSCGPLNHVFLNSCLYECNILEYNMISVTFVKGFFVAAVYSQQQQKSNVGMTIKTWTARLPAESRPVFPSSWERYAQRLGSRPCQWIWPTRRLAKLVQFSDLDLEQWDFQCLMGDGMISNYPQGKVYIAMENDYFEGENSLFPRPFSIAMLN